MEADDGHNPNVAFAVDVVRRLRDAGFQAFWAGGCVRDLIMGTPPEDYDVATSARPDQVRDVFGHRKTLVVGAAFGVIIVQPPHRDTQPVEVATFRTDGSYSDGRRPDAVVFSTDKEDAQRRDFTINGMFYDPLAQRVIDYVGGLQDLERHMIRAIGDADARIGEDKLRMLRAVRFAARFGFQIAPETLAAINRHAPSLSIVSGERTAIEIQKTLVTRRAPWGVEQWGETGLLNVFAPEIAWPDRRQQIVALLEAQQQLAQELPHITRDWRLAMACLLWGGSPIESRAESHRGLIETLRDRLRWSNVDAQCLQFVLDSQLVLSSAHELAWSQIQPYLIGEYARSAVSFLQIRSHLQPELSAAAAWLLERLELPPEQLDPPPLLAGQDLIRLGFKPGPQFKRLISSARSLQLDGKLNSKQQALQWAQQQPTVPNRALDV